MSLTSEIISKIKSQVDILEIVGNYVNLTQSGSNFKGLSPFQEEKTPSFFVNPQKQLFYCFSSKTGGDIISFIQKMENISFIESLKILGKHAGINVESFLGKKVAPKDQERNDQLFEINQRASLYFQSLLKENKEVQNYLKKRGITPESFLEFGLGCCSLEWSKLTDTLKAQGFSENFLLQSGLIKKGRNGKLFDLFRNRVLFPIHNLSGQIVGFGARALAENEPKYINSPETGVYKKSELLYGLFAARDAARKEKKIILVEGYMDFISLFQSGIKNCAATCGTALTKTQAYTLKRFSDEVILLFDGDAAGIKAAQRAIPILLQQNLKVSIAPLPTGKDPDNLIQERGPENFKTFVNKAIDWLSFLFRAGQKQFKMDDPYQKGHLIHQWLFPCLAAIPDEIVKIEFIRQSSEKFNLPQDILIRQLDKFQKKPLRQNSRTSLKPALSSQLTQSKKQFQFESHLIAGLVRQTEICRSILIDSQIQFGIPLYKEIYDFYQSLKDLGGHFKVQAIPWDTAHDKLLTAVASKKWSGCRSNGNVLDA